MRGTTRLDALVATGFTAAAIGEAVLRFHDTPARLALNVAGALVLMALAVRRTHPLLTLSAIGMQAVVVALITHAAWPGSPVEATVGVLAMMLATYSVGAHASGPAALAVALVVPLVVVLATDLSTLHGWSLVSGVLFVTVFVGALPVLVGRLVQTRARTVERLRNQCDAIVHGQAAQRETAVVAERVAVAERLGPALVTGLHRLATDAAKDAPAGEIEDRARLLLARTRQEVGELTAEVDPGPAPGPAFALPPSTWDNAVAPTWLVLVALGSMWGVTVAIAQSLGPLGDNLVEAGLALGTSLVAGLLLRWPTTVLGLLVCVAGHWLSTGLDDLAGTTAAMVAAWAAGLVLRDLSSLALQLRATNDELAGQVHWRAEHAIVAERRRIARDLHDELGHTLTVVALQACAARRMADTDPARAREIVRSLAQVAHDGVLALGPDGVLAAGEDPTPGLGELLTRTRAAGTDVSGEVADEACLSEEGRAVVYRLVQESLTNVLRHAPGARASVVVRRREVQVEIAVTNTAPTGNPGPAGSGRGLTGICERVTACAGEVSWGPDADGGFTVLARLPMAMEMT